MSINKEIDADESQIKSIGESFGIVLNNNQRAFLKVISIKNAESYFDDGVDFEVKDAEELKVLHTDLCMECGSCSFVCPAKRPVAQTMKEAKDFLRKAGN